MTTIYTYGYTGGSPNDLARYSGRFDAIVCDIRYSPRSRIPHWNSDALARLLRQYYVAIPNFGNKNYRGDLGEGIMLASPAQGVSWVRTLTKGRDKSVILLCACAAVESCHRSMVAEILRLALDLPVIHLPARLAHYEAQLAQTSAPVQKGIFDENPS